MHEQHSLQRLCLGVVGRQQAGKQSRAVCGHVHAKTGGEQRADSVRSYSAADKAQWVRVRHA